MVIESYFAPGDHTRALGYEVTDSLPGSLIKQSCVVRMNANCRVDVLVAFSEFDGTFQCATMRIAGSDIQNRLYSGIACALNHLRAIHVILRTVDVSVGINEHRKDGLWS